MGEMMSNDRQAELVAKDHATEKPSTDAKQGTNAPDGKFKTDVDGVFSDGEKTGLPVFAVSSKEFYNNMKTDRRRLRFSTGTNAQKYHKNTKYRRPFYIQNKDDGFSYKIK